MPVLTVTIDFDAIFAARVVTASVSRAAGTTRLTRPKRNASSAPNTSPVSNISMACLEERLRDSATIGVEQNRPILTPGVQKRASCDATARSQVATSWQPAALARPATSAMTGFGLLTIPSISSAQEAKSAAKYAAPLSWSARWAVISLRLWPDEKAGPRPASTITRTALSAAATSSADFSSAIIASDRLLRVAASASVRRSTPPSRAESRSAVILPRRRAASASGRRQDHSSCPG